MLAFPNSELTAQFPFKGLYQTQVTFQGFERAPGREQDTRARRRLSLLSGLELRRRLDDEDYDLSEGLRGRCLAVHTAMGARTGVAVLCCVLALSVAEQQEQKQPSDQLGAATVTSSGSDLTGAASQGHGGHGGEKFFMYAHQPDKKQYEFGFKRGNDYHTIERYEKGGPHHNFKAKVRWEDSKGGYGEHYWDYNHAPKHHDDHHDDHHGGGGGHHDDHHGGGGGYHDDHHGGGGGYHGDHHGGGGGHHDDHHGGGGGYHDDHHGDGGYHDSHNDHGGYHSQPVPDFAPALASSSSPKVVGEREGRAYTPSAQHRRRPKATSAGNKVGVEKVSGLEEKEPRKEVAPRKNKNGRKKYGFINERRSFEYSRTFDRDGEEPEKKGAQEAVESLSARASGFDQTPDLSNTKLYPRSSASSSTPSSYSSPPLSSDSKKVSESKKFSARLPSSSPQRAFNNRRFKRPRHRSSSISTTTSFPLPLPSPPPQRKKPEESTTSPSPSSPAPSPSPSISPSGLAFDMETGRVYDEQAGVWYSLVPVTEP
ncbi:insulin receptor substrate 4-like [Penaeus chinensis]|uniref:insulin receptor substrate 4-like n=1 Tax=Penaeus chinensis TaxID=139456 RepID=UPI001FB84023|nr:insulin receptor substrate 4-like [Penaeus chinensis]